MHLRFYIRTKKQNSDIEILKTKAVNIEHSDLNYAQLDFEYYQENH
ncbi:hypothetical protein rpr22_CDSx779 [Rickettsia prowazekii str. Rp22]|uniref:Uncharacterized protein n=1 Tax=Rickettsia prowazekii (strain Rp22) TaxID=449216 RepID=D5AXY1_RICPP|nr:hypothetical protein rpr22_CDSx779 [Rickettsia prowazekii str. Rp22]